MKLVILAAVVSVNVSCAESPQSSADNRIVSTIAIYDVKNLVGSWSRSYEEEPIQTDPEVAHPEVYRPTESREFPPSWFRMRYVFNEDRSCDRFVLHPADAHYMTSGAWAVDPDDERVIWVYDADGVVNSAVSFRVIELTEELLRVERLH